MNRRMKVRVILDVSEYPVEGEAASCHENRRFSKMVELGPEERSALDVIKAVDGCYGDAAEALEQELQKEQEQGARA
jgi:hypothetical protein